MPEKAWKRSWVGALAGDGKEEQSIKSIVASEEENSDAEIIINKKVKHVTFLGFGDPEMKTRTIQTKKRNASKNWAVQLNK